MAKKYIAIVGVSFFLFVCVALSLINFSTEPEMEPVYYYKGEVCGKIVLNNDETHTFRACPPFEPSLKNLETVSNLLKKQKVGENISP